MAERAIWTALVIFLAPFAALCVANSFFLHMTPDTGQYLLDTRTFLETGSRYGESFGSKGIVLALMLAPGVFLFGPTMVAAAFCQAFAYAAVAAVMYRIGREETDNRTAVLGTLTWLIAAFSPFMWGGRVRPDDFGAALTAGALWAAWKGSPKLLLLAGGLAAACAFLKSSLFLAPLAVGLVGALLRPDGRSLKRIGWAEASFRWVLPVFGFVLVSALLFGWIWIFDDMRSWYEQAVSLPKSYRDALAAMELRPDGGGVLFELFHATRLNWLVIGSAVGLGYACFVGRTRLALLIAVLLTAEAFRIEIEGTIWRYHATGMLAPLILAACCWRIPRRAEAQLPFAWILPPALLSSVLLATMIGQTEAFRIRMIERTPSPGEFLVQRMRPVYRIGEGILPLVGSVETVLRLGAPRPSGVLPHYLPFTSVDRQREEVAAYITDPPTWVIDSEAARSSVACYGTGGIDDVVFAQFSAVQKQQVAFSHGRFGVGESFIVDGDIDTWREQLLTRNPYKLAVDTGCFQAWRLAEAGYRELR